MSGESVYGSGPGAPVRTMGPLPSPGAVNSPMHSSGALGPLPAPSAASMTGSMPGGAYLASPAGAGPVAVPPGSAGAALPVASAGNAGGDATSETTSQLRQLVAQNASAGLQARPITEVLAGFCTQKFPHLQMHVDAVMQANLADREKVQRLSTIIREGERQGAAHAAGMGRVTGSAGATGPSMPSFPPSRVAQGGAPTGVSPSIGRRP
jgi:hypothetical protein